MGAELFVLGSAAFLESFMPGIALAAGLENFEVFPVNPDPNVLEHTVPAAEGAWTGQLVGMQCAAGDQTYVFDAVNEKAWSEQTSWFKDGMTKEKMIEFMEKRCGPGTDIPIS